MEELEPTLASKEDRPSFRAANEPGISWLLIIFFLIKHIISRKRTELMKKLNQKKINHITKEGDKRKVDFFP